MRWLGRAACVNSGPPSIAFSRLLKKYSTMKTSYGRKRHAWRRSSTEYMCSVICRPEARVRKDHPLRVIRAMVDEVLAQLSRRFDSKYAKMGRPSIAPEKLLRAQLLQMLYSIRRERDRKSTRLNSSHMSISYAVF